MGIALALASTFFFEEIITTTSVLTVAYHQHFPILLIHAIWFVVVFLETIIIYLVGTWLRKRVRHTKMDRWLTKYVDLFEQKIGIHGKYVSIGTLAFFLSPGLASLISVWLGTPLVTSVTVIVLCDFVWYLFEWSIVIGVAHFSLSLEVLIGITMGIGVAISIAIHALRKKLNA